MRSDASPTARALLALELVQGSPGITAALLADKLGVSERAARRYVGILREAGIPIESVRGPYGGYRVGRGLRLPPLMFSSTEALGLVMAVLDGHHDAGDPTGLVGGAIGKIVRALPEPVAAQAEAVRRTTAAAPDRAAARPDPGTTTTLVQACSDRRRVRIAYRSEAGSEWSTDVDPWAVVVRHGRWYLLCRTHPRDAVRAYRVDRVSAVEVLDRHLHPAGRPRPGRHARVPPRRRLGVRRRRRHRRPDRRGRARACAAPSAVLEPHRLLDHPSGRQHQQPGVVRRAARGDPGVVPRSWSHPSSARPRRSWAAAAGGRTRWEPGGRAARRGDGCLRLRQDHSWRSDWATASGWPSPRATPTTRRRTSTRWLSGQPLTDEDRRPWLDALVAWTRERDAEGVSTVLSCSALRRRYRDVLREADPDTFFVHLHADFDVLAERMRRRAHFMPLSLLESQFDTLEPLGDGELGVADRRGPPGGRGGGGRGGGGPPTSLRLVAPRSVVDRARRWARSPCLPNRLRNSTGSAPAAPNQCGTRVSNSAASPGSSTRSCSPSTSRSRPLRT